MKLKLRKRVVQLGLQHGMPFADLAVFVGMPYTDFRRYCVSWGLPVPPPKPSGRAPYHDGPTLLRLKRTGLPLTQIAAALQIPYATLWNTILRAEEKEKA